MSLDAVIGRIDQIMSLRQQVIDPAAATATATAGASTGTAAAASSTPASFADMLAGAQQDSAMTTAVDPSTESDDLAGLSSDGGLTDPISSGVSDPITLAGLQSTAGAGTLTGALDTSGLNTSGLTGTTDFTGLTDTTGLTGTTTAPAQVQSMAQEADSLVGKPYIWGGGHSGWGEQPGYDCSGFVSAVLHAGGYLSAPQDTQTLPDQPGIEDGPGQSVTIYDRTDAGSGQDHVIIDLGGQFYESGGGSGAWGGGGGVEKIGTPSAAYLASFNRVLHPEGL